MPAKNINRTARHRALADRTVKNRQSQNASEAVRDALREGTDALERGDYVEVTASRLDALLGAPMTRTSKRHSRARRP